MATWSGETPAGTGRDADRTAPAGTSGEDALGVWRKALAAHNAARRRRTGRRKSGGYRAGMARRPPPPPDGNDAA